jgi:hypothetical protein
MRLGHVRGIIRKRKDEGKERSLVAETDPFETVVVRY